MVGVGRRRTGEIMWCWWWWCLCLAGVAVARWLGGAAHTTLVHSTRWRRPCRHCETGMRSCTREVADCIVDVCVRTTLRLRQVSEGLTRVTYTIPSPFGGACAGTRRDASATHHVERGTSHHPASRQCSSSARRLTDQLLPRQVHQRGAAAMLRLQVVRGTRRHTRRRKVPHPHTRTHPRSTASRTSHIAPIHAPRVSERTACIFLLPL